MSSSAEAVDVAKEFPVVFYSSPSIAGMAGMSRKSMHRRDRETYSDTLNEHLTVHSLLKLWFSASESFCTPSVLHKLPRCM